MGSDPHGRRHASPAWLKAGREAAGSGAIRGRKLVVQMVETFREHMAPVFVDRLDAWALQESMGAELPPIMIYGDDVSHIVSEEGIANLLLCRGPEEREQAIRGVAGFTPAGMARDRRAVENLRDRGIIRRPGDDAGLCDVSIKTSARGFGEIWHAVLAEFADDNPAGGTRILINDMGATPAVVSLRLGQALMEYLGDSQ